MNKKLPQPEIATKSQEEELPRAAGGQTRFGLLEEAEDIRTALGIVDGQAIVTLVSSED